MSSGVRFFGSALAVAVGLAIATHVVAAPSPVAAAVTEPTVRTSATAAPSGPAASGPRVIAPSRTRPVSAPTPTATPKASPSPTSAGPVGIPTPAPTRVAVPQPPRGSKVLYLSFDDGPSPQWTPTILSVLAEHHAHATFFMIGKAAAEHPGLVRSVRAAGHSIGNHTWSHADLVTLTNSQIREEVVRAGAVLGATKCTRPPFGAVTPRVAAQLADLGQRSQLWDIDPRDWSRPGATAIVKTVRANLRSGAVLLLHDGGGDRSQSLAALRTLLATLSASGWSFQAIPGC